MHERDLIMENNSINNIEKLDNFKFILDSWIIPLVDKLKNQMDKEFIVQCNVKIRPYKEFEKEINSFYHKKRKLLKLEYYGKDYEKDANNPHRMDFHKLSAVICRTMIEYKLFDFDVNACYDYIESRGISKDDTDWLVKNALVNFRLAFYSSVVFLYQSMIFCYDKSNDEEKKHIAKRLRELKKLDLYINSNLSNSHESFVNCMILDLAKRDIDDRSFDYFMYSIIMYQLEEYNKMLLS